jgi:hypothetical protein
MVGVLDPFRDTPRPSAGATAKVRKRANILRESAIDKGESAEGGTSSAAQPASGGR